MFRRTLSIEVISIHALREEGDLRALVKTRFDVDFYPRPPRGGRLIVFRRTLSIEVISIHALREEGDVQPEILRLDADISIHALREEGDPKSTPIWRKPN